MIIAEVRKHYQNLKLSKKGISKAITFILFLFAASSIWNHFQSSRYFPIQEVKIAGIEHVSHQELQRTLLPFVKTGFFAVDIEAIKEQLLHYSWVSEAYVTRVWPNQIMIQVIEKKPIARWNGHSLLTSSGEVFSPHSDNSPEALPQFIGPEGEHMQMLNYYHNINRLLVPLQVKIEKLELSSAMLWQVTLTNGIKLNMGYKDILTRVDHFVKVYPKIVGDRDKEVDYVDLRYNNGFAVRWKA